MSDRFEAAWPKLEVEPNDFIRTTQPRHEKLRRRSCGRRSRRTGDLYLGDYEGWYCVGCEELKTEKELDSPGNLCPLHRDARRAREGGDVLLPPVEVRGAAPRLLRGAPRVHPARDAPQRGAQLRRGGPARTSRVSRTSFTWGIPVPGNPKHVMYVWFDALTNYWTRAPGPRGAQGVLDRRERRAPRRQGHPALPRRVLAGVPAERGAPAAEARSTRTGF